MAKLRPLPVGHQKIKVATNLATIVQRLPLHSLLSDSQTVLINLMPIWLQWCKEQREKQKNQNFACAQNAVPTAVKGSTLTISCTNATTASQLKHLQVSFLQHLLECGFQEIKQLKIHVTFADQDLTQTSQTSRLSEPTTQSREKPPAAIIKSIDATTRAVKNKSLAESLNRLSNTLKNID